MKKYAKKDGGSQDEIDRKRKVDNMSLVEIKLMNYVDKCYKVLYLADVNNGTGAEAWHRFSFKQIFNDARSIS